MLNIFRFTKRPTLVAWDDRQHVDHRDDRRELRGLLVNVVERKLDNLDNITRALTGYKLG